MHGFQICLLHLNESHGDYWLTLLDENTDAPGWPGTLLSLDDEDNIVDDKDVMKMKRSTTKVEEMISD